jgi:probable HAF family extracellular repeat protein
MNASGAVVGTIDGGNGHAFVLGNGIYQDLGTLPGGNWSAGYAINNSGEIFQTGPIASRLAASPAKRNP